MWKWQYDNKACACSSKREKAERAEHFGYKLWNVQLLFWADLLKNELFVVLQEGESFSTRVCSPCGTKVRNCPGKLHGDAFAN